jgi:RNA polymerase sigma-70 factor (ECF subfamily)
VFLRLLRIPDHEAIRDPRAYLYTVASHVLHQYALRRTALRRWVDLDCVSAEAVPEYASDPAEELLIEQRFGVLGQRLKEHAPRAYVTLVLYRIEGATFEEIGRRLGVTRVMAKKYLIQAMSYCQKVLDDTE